MKRGQRLITLAAIAGVFVLGASACSSDATPTGSGGNSDGGVDIYTKLGVAPPGTKLDDGTPTPVPYRYDQVKSPYDSTDGCKSFSSADFPAGFMTDARSCLCDNCFDLQQQCDALQGCQQEMNCILSIGCTDSNSCYLAPAMTSLDPMGKGCVTVIDQWGNSGVSTALANQIGDCGKANGCIMAAPAK